MLKNKIAMKKNELKAMCCAFDLAPEKNINAMNKKQLEELLMRKMPLIKKMYGNGFFSNIADKIKKVFFFPPNKLPGNSQKVFEKYKNNKVIGLTAQREPIAKGVEVFMNLITLGKFKQAKDKVYDELFHLSLVVRLDNNKRILIEKNERISITEKVYSTREYMPIHNPRPLVTLDKLLENTREYMGDDAFFSYSGRRNNCQSFIAAIVTANGVSTPQNIKWIKQDTESIFSESPGYLEAVQQFITDSAGKASQLITGQGYLQ